MSNLAKAVFPACASFGPLMLAFGSLLPNRDGTPYGLIVTLPGAAMTVAALLILFRMRSSVAGSDTRVPRDAEQGAAADGGA